MSEELKTDSEDTVRSFRRLLHPIWMHLAQQSLAGDKRPMDDAVMFSFMGSGGSDWTTFGDFVKLMGDPWEDSGTIAQEITND